MAYNLEQWKKAIWANLTGWKARLVPTVVNSGYVAVAAGALWPLLYEARTGDAYGAAVALMSLTAGLGTNLLSEQIQRWKDEANGEPDLAHWLQEHVQSDVALRAEVDQVLEKVEALGLARTALADEDRAWFEDTLRRELAAVGNLPRFVASVSGERNVLVQGTGHNVTITIEHQEIHHHYAPDPRAIAADAAAAARRDYLTGFARWCNTLPLAALGGEEGAADELKLDQVYIGLHTESRVPLTEAEKEERKKNREFRPRPDPRDDESRARTAQEVAAEHTRLVLLGDPGSGKSTFARYWLRQLALAGLGKGQPPLGLTPDLLPVFVTLRDLAPRLAPLDFQQPLTDDNKRQLIDAIFAQLEKDLRGAPEFAEGLRRAVDEGAVVLVLDGLDEVADKLRERVRWAVGALVAECQIARVMITCRVRSYGGAAVFPGFHPETLAPFTAQHIHNFTGHWYDAQSARFDADQATAKAQDLERAALDEDLFSLAQNPMMLTSMAILHQREIGLPRQRVMLFNQLVDVLLRRWQKNKAEVLEGTLLEDFLKDELRLRAVVERLAFEVHAVGASDDRGAARATVAGDLSRGAALVLLERAEYLQSAARAGAFLDYIDQRAGLLVGRGGEPGHPASYSFPHRTLQEYLAGRHLTRGLLPHREHDRLAGHGDYWAQAAQYGAEDLLYNRQQPDHLRHLAYQLLRQRCDTTHKRRAALWSGNYAALVGPEAIAADPDPQGGPDYLARLRPTLVDLLSSDLTAIERAEAGRSLALLGDPRPEVMTVEGMRFAFVPAGPFRMGSDKANDPELYEDEEPAHTLELSDSWIGVHTVTNAQFEAFIADEGYGEAMYWPEAIAAEYWKDGRFKGRWDDEPRIGPERFRGSFDLANHPVVGISWYEALAFTRWLNRVYGAQLPDGMAFGLPSEAEWEKAARGGLRLPASLSTRALQEGLALTPVADPVQNPLPERRYPWGDDFDSDRTNTAAAGVRSTSALGAFSKDESPYGCQDLSGNVWEWTRSHNNKYPYVPTAEREELAAGADTARVLRGGAYVNGARNSRCANRLRGFPYDWYVSLGFRVVASPFFSRL